MVLLVFFSLVSVVSFRSFRFGGFVSLFRVLVRKCPTSPQLYKMLGRKVGVEEGEETRKAFRSLRTRDGEILSEVVMQTATGTGSVRYRYLYIALTVLRKTCQK